MVSVLGPMMEVTSRKGIWIRRMTTTVPRKIRPQALSAKMFSPLFQAPLRMYSTIESCRKILSAYKTVKPMYSRDRLPTIPSRKRSFCSALRADQGSLSLSQWAEAVLLECRLVKGNLRSRKESFTPRFPLISTE